MKPQTYTRARITTFLTNGQRVERQVKYDQEKHFYTKGNALPICSNSTEKIYMRRLPTYILVREGIVYKTDQIYFEDQSVDWDLIEKYICLTVKGKLT